MQQVMKIKVIRFFLNFIIYAGFLSSAVFYVYSQPPELYPLKDILLPINSAFFVSIIFSLILAGLNEITSMILIKKIRG